MADMSDWHDTALLERTGTPPPAPAEPVPRRREYDTPDYSACVAAEPRRPEPAARRAAGPARPDRTVIAAAGPARSRFAAYAAAEPARADIADWQGASA